VNSSHRQFTHLDVHDFLDVAHQERVILVEARRLVGGETKVLFTRGNRVKLESLRVRISRYVGREGASKAAAAKKPNAVDYIYRWYD
jgi:hypothetical protein